MRVRMQDGWGKVSSRAQPVAEGTPVRREGKAAWTMVPALPIALCPAGVCERPGLLTVFRAFWAPAQTGVTSYATGSARGVSGRAFISRDEGALDDEVARPRGVFLFKVAVAPAGS